MNPLASPELRYNPITLDWVIMAAARERRPDDFHKAVPEPRPTQPPFNETCPFCPGNEKQTAQELVRESDPSGTWAVRAFANKFPAFSPTPDLHRQAHDSFRSMAAAGAHEVVVEHPRHDLALADMDVSHLAAILRVYRARYMELKKAPHVRGIVIFKNHGERAGSSLLHPHSQIIAAPVVSCQVRMRLHEARRFHEVHGECLYCSTMDDELKAGERIVETGNSFTAFVPYASLSPYHLWIFPTTHAPSYDSITDAQIQELAGVLKRLLVRLRTAAGDPDFNITIRSAPVGEESACCFHWYIAIVPRLSHLAGFELGSGTYINSLPSEVSAENLRRVQVEGVSASVE
ncbi:galactose-1-phosphate uridylyltransferase [Roseimicrobium sp. ORNL1]|uniref:galactose-1-phosphate uridylyltransferase n=1 Tax=Roseimicrobium sp. ORNL1 TaxID=2711231 RepID=UPI0013E1F72B|nr:galactose-1-phosphate uridylyltransferase [Roseimicrobium sp. ORNL1]QIF03065.1 galactose-1-phosphate uridylyltransferase [Roseimicrobium sp. ORNL1]